MLNEIVPQMIYSKGIDLHDSVGVNEIAWYFSDALEVIQFLRLNNFVILGGDVYKMGKEGIEVTFDNWYFDKSCGENQLNESAEKAKSYISNYHARNGDGFAYTFVFKSI